MERDLRLVDDDDGVLGSVEEYGVEQDEDLLLPRGQLLQLEGGAVVHPDADLPGLGDRDGLVDEDVADDVLEDDDRFSEQVVPVHVVRDGAGQVLVALPVLDDVVPGRGELQARRDRGFESRLLDEIQLRLQVLAPELQVAVGHVPDVVPGMGLQLPVLLRVPDGLQQLLRVDLQRRSEVAVPPLEGEPLGRDVDGVADGCHLPGRERRLQLALLHLHEQVPGIVLDDEVAAVVESDVHPVEDGVLEVADIPVQRGVDHPHDCALAQSVRRMDEREGLTELHLVIELVEQPGYAERLDLHGRHPDADIPIKTGQSRLQPVFILDESSGGRWTRTPLSMRYAR